MPKILVLPDHVASQIAAGEVVERPSSVVKELVENSIDAGATQVEISIGADTRDIRIADNGCGMEPDDAVLAFSRHATSKLASADDLWTLRTLGFRGEALPSIASISKFTCFTRTAEAQQGTRIEVKDGSVSASETGCAQGTVMEITDLFYNVPARLKFLKKASTEFAHIHETVQALAVSFPKVMFQLLNQGELVFKTSGSGKLAQAIVEAGIFSGREELVEVLSADTRFGMAVYGYLARPTHFRGDRKCILSIVNNRAVRCPLTYKALDYAYSDLIPKGKYPLAVLTVTIDPNQVDVNIHPTKKEVKYTSGNEVYSAIQRSLLDALRQQRPQAEDSSTQMRSPANGGNSSVAINDDNAAVESHHAMQSHATPTGGTPAATLAGSGVNPSHPYAEDTRTESSVAEASRPEHVQQLRFKDRLAYVPPFAPVAPTPGSIPLRSRVLPTLPAGYRIAGYVHNTYIILETTDGMEIVEQHIAHERLIYERLLAGQQTPGRVSESSQRLVISAPLNLSPEQREMIDQHLEKFQALGFDFENQSGNIVCTQVPLELAHKDYAVVVQEMVDTVSKTDHANLELEATKSIACQSAIKNGMALGESEMIQLLCEWFKAPRNDTCPHGRPIRQVFSKDKLFQMFHPG